MVKGKVLPYSLPSVGPGADLLYEQSTRKWLFQVIQVVGCHYFPPGLRSPSQLKNVTVLWPVPSYTAWWQRRKAWTTCPRLLRRFLPGGNWTHDLSSQVQRGRRGATPLRHLSTMYTQYFQWPERFCLRTPCVEQFAADLRLEMQFSSFLRQRKTILFNR